MAALAVALAITPSMAGAAADRVDPPEQAASGPVEVGYRDLDFGPRVHSTPTAEKPESKVWWHDDSWWGCLWEEVADTYRIYRLDASTQTWISVGPDADNRSDTIVDVLWDGVYLYILSHEHDGSQPAMLWSYTYSTGPGTYALRAGFPVTVSGAGPEAATIAKDTTGKLWVTWEESSDIMVTCSTTNELTWRTPFRLPVQGADVSIDDISVVTSFAGKIGILWSNQNDDKVYFAAHVDGQPDTSWDAREEALVDPALAVTDDHLNIAVDGDNVYAVTKTSVDFETDPAIYLIRRDAAGSWTRHVVALKSDSYTRPCVVIDDENDKIHVFATCTSGDDTIRKKTSDLSSISFPPGLGEVFIQSVSDHDINDPTSTKQNVNGRSNLLVIASDHKSDYYLHNYLDLPGSEADIAVTPSSHDYGDVRRGGSVTQTFEVRNEGVLDLSVTSTLIVGADAAEFAIDSGGGAFVLAPGGSRDIVARFAPSALGSLSATLQIASDDPDEDPMNVALSGVGVEPDITVTPAAHDYANVPVGSSVARAFQYRNDGTADLSVLSTTVVGADSTEFSIDTYAAPVLLAPGASHNFIVTFNPTAPGAMNAALRIMSDDPDEGSVDVVLSGSGIGPDIAVAPSTHDYGPVLTGQASAWTFEVRNEGTADLNVTSTSLIGPDSTVFAIDSGGGAFLLAPGGTRDVVVSFNPVAPEARSATLQLSSDDPDEGALDVSLSGTGVEPDIVATPAVYDYGDVLVGQSVTQTFEIRNDGSADLNVISTVFVGADSTEFTVDSGAAPFVVAPGDTHDVVVNFSPDSLGGRSAMLRIASDDPDSGLLDAALSGMGVEPDIAATPAAHDYGNVWVGQGATQTFGIRNDGIASLNVTSTVFVGADSTEFTVDSGVGPFVVAPGDTHDVVVSFSPDSLGGRSTTLQIASDDPDQALLDVALTGTGVLPDITLTPEIHDYGNVVVRDSLSQTFEVRNDGNTDLSVVSTVIVGADSTHFEIESGGGAFVIAPGDTQDVVVGFSPDSSGALSAALRIVSDDPDEGISDVALSGVGIGPNIVATPATHDYGGVWVGEGAAQTFEIRNDGNADLNVTSTLLFGADSTLFAIDSGGGPFVVAPGDTHDVVVSFSPDSLGGRSATLRIASDDPTRAVLDLGLTGAGVLPDVALTPEMYDYGNVVVGDSLVQTFEVRNDGSTDLSIASMTIVGADSTVFTIDSGSSPFVVAPGDTHDVVVSFNPDSSGARSAALRIASDDPDSGLLDAALTGMGVQPDVAVTPSAIDYDSVLVGSSATHTVGIWNHGTSNLNVTSMVFVGADSTEFTIESGGAPFAVGPGDSNEVFVRFAPDSLGAASTTLRIASDDPDEGTLDIALVGAGVEPDITVAPAAHNYGDVILGQDSTSTFGVRNDGTWNLDVTSTAIVGADSTFFTIESGGGIFSLAPGDSHEIAVRFDAATLGPKGAALRIGSNDPDESPLDVELAGNAVRPPEPVIAVTPAHHIYGETHVGLNVTQTFEVRNDGAMDLNVASTTIVGADSTEFSIQSGGGAFNVAPGDSHAVVVRFHPDSVGAKSTTLQIASDDPDDGVIDVALLGVGVEPEIAVSPSAHDYGAILVGQDTTQIFEVWNSGTADLDVTSTTFVGTDSTAFAIDVGGGAFTVAPGDTQAIVVRFSPTVPGSLQAALRIANSDSDEPFLDVGLAGTGIEPSLSVTPAAHDFGTLLVGSSATQAIQIRNDGTTNRAVTSMAFVGADSTLFTIESGGGAFSVAPGDSHSVIVRFSPDSLGVRSTTLRIMSDDPHQPTFDVALTGSGEAAPEPQIAVTPVSHDYGPVLVKSSASLSFEILNDGSGDLDILSTAIVGTDANSFQITSGGGGARTLLPGESHVIPVRFNPVLPGPKSATLRISSNDPDENPVDITLAGNGVVRPSNSGKFVLDEISSGFAAHTTSVSTESDALGTDGDRYVVAIVLDGSNTVAKVSGLGLKWTPLREEGAAESARVEVWVAAGVPTPGHVTATFREIARTALIAVVGHTQNEPLHPGEEAQTAGGRSARPEQGDGDVAQSAADPRGDYMEIAKKALVHALQAGDVPALQAGADLPRDVGLAIAAPQSGFPAIEVATHVTTQVRITVHDVRGRLVHTLWNETMTAGRHRLEWRADGSRSGSGVYFIRAEIGAHLLTRKLLLVR